MVEEKTAHQRGGMPWQCTQLEQGKGIKNMKAFYELRVRIFDGDTEVLCEVIPWGVPSEIWDGTQDVVDFLQD
jgi:hypothetical protein